ncbi:uncharacterized protein CXQ87_002302 [Candidozyma duobushaemuli]|nr:uncharacterized protein CXQ87_002302 [[Candida] duobushaemulonis]PVH14177.1 hypothetical protein CXQ87_002302 [[Candida] duobushaemulonis]
MESNSPDMRPAQPEASTSAESKPPAAQNQSNYKSSNPFANGQFATRSSTETTETSFFTENDNIQHVATSLPRDVLKKAPFKTSNRIFSDLKYTPRFFQLKSSSALRDCKAASLLSSKPADYAKQLSSVLVTENDHFEPLILNNAVEYVPAFHKVDLPEKSLSVTVIRGLLVRKISHEIFHFRLAILEQNRPPVFSIDKHEYHVLSREQVSPDDFESLGEDKLAADSIVDDVFYKSANTPHNHILRVTVFHPEFTNDESHAMTDVNVVNERFAEKIKEFPESPSAQVTKFDPIHCIQTLIKVLKGPIVLPEDQPLQTIPRMKSALDAKLDTSLLFDKLGFTLNEEEQLFVPPNLAKDPVLRESFIRKAYELLFIGKLLRTSSPNDFDRQFSYNDSMSRAFTALGEVDKYSSVTSFRQDSSDKFSFFVALSSFTFYQDELIIRCFENTVSSDPSNKLYYVDSFKNLLAFRSSRAGSRLQSYYQNQYNKGLMYGFSEYKDALKSIGIEGVSVEDNVDDEVVIGMYKQACKNDHKNYTYYNKQLRIIATIKHSPELIKFLDKELIPAQIALEELRIEELTEDDVVVTAYEFRLDEVLQSVNFNTESQEIRFLKKCLLSIAISRKSYILMNYIELKSPDLSQEEPQLSVDEALEFLDSDRQTNDFEITAKFQDKMATSEVGDVGAFMNLRASLRTLAEIKKSDILASFLRNGKIDSSLLPPENWPAGLDNIGNTCYLNSLLQYYFCIKPLRETILSFDDTNLESLKVKKRRVGGRDVEQSELERSGQFVFRLQSLFSEMITTRSRCVQPSKELAYLSFLPLSQSVEFKDESATAKADEILSSDMDVEPRPFSDQRSIDDVDMSDKENEPASKNQQASDDNLLDLSEEEKNDTKLSSVEELSIKEDESSKAPLESEDAADEKPQKKIMSISTDQMESTIEIGRQQDVTECIENVTFQIETALEPTKIDDDGEQYDLVKQLFCGKTKQTITPLEEGTNATPRSSFERFFSLIINVSDHPKDIYDALDNYFIEDIMNLEEGQVKKSTTITELPEILQFHVQRVLFDRERLMAYKSLEVIPFKETIYLDRYLDTDDEELKRKRSQVYEWKTEIKKLSEEKDALLQVDPETKLSAIDSLQATKKFLETKLSTFPELSIKPETIEAIGDQITEFKGKLQSIHDEIKVLQEKSSNQFDDYQKVGYTLFAIFIHRGEASYGHYWVYIKDLKRNIFRKYNDDSVTEVPASEVLNFAEGNTATPYYMVFVKDELKETYIEPLKREIPE